MRRLNAGVRPWRAATTATTRPPGTAKPKIPRGRPRKRATTRQRADASTRPCLNPQLLSTGHRAET
ncbi:hypothetical protein ABTL34_19420, partial [Acinetobacter baumannii]